MNTPQSPARILEPAPWVASPKSISPSEPRLVVVVSGVSDQAALARRILALSSDTDAHVLLAGVAPTWDTEYELRRSLVAVESFLAAQGSRVELWTDSGHGWIERLAAKCQPSDRVACYEEVVAAYWKQPLSDLLTGALHLPVRDMTDLMAHSRARARIFPHVAAWLGSIAIIAGFLLLEARIVTEMYGWPQNVMLLLAISAEIYLIWLWNAILG